MRSAPFGFVKEEARRLAQTLRDLGAHSPHLERLRAHLDLEGQVEEVEVEIRREMAAALGRAGAKVDLALLRLDVAHRQLDAAPDDEGRLEAYRSARQLAVDARLELRIHREAVGLRYNATLARDYPIPPVHPRARRSSSG